MKKAFTLMELSIVLVIIATLITLSLAGNNLYELSKIHSVASTMTAYQSAYNNYKIKYIALPGDDASAFDHFNTKCASTDVLCNGNGNRKLGDSDEIYKFFRHVWLSGFAQDNLNGLAAGGPQINVNVPATAMKGKTFLPYSINRINFFQTAIGESFDESKATLNALIFARAESSSPTTQTIGASIDGRNARTIDRKIDDGRPGTGIVIAGRAAAGTVCTSSSDYRSATYITTTTAENCKMAYILDSKQ